jgi:hypothetical protein
MLQDGVFIMSDLEKLVGSANVVTGSNFRARKYKKPRDGSSRNFVPVTIFASFHPSATGC